MPVGWRRKPLGRGICHDWVGAAVLSPPRSHLFLPAGTCAPPWRPSSVSPPLVRATSPALPLPGCQAEVAGPRPVA